MRYRYVGAHADTLDSGQPVGPGDFVELEDEDVRLPQNEMFLADGRLIAAEEGDAEKEASLASRRVQSRERKLEREQDTDDDTEGGKG